MKAVILRGQPVAGAGRLDEADTGVQADYVRGLLQAGGWSIDESLLSLNLEQVRSELLAADPDLVVNLVEAVGGRGELIHLGPLLLDHLDLAYTGCPQAAVYQTSNKLLAKEIMGRAGLPTPALWPAPAQARDGARWIVKSVWEHASLGLDGGSVLDRQAVAGMLGRQAARFGGQWFAEVYVPGREFNLSLLEGPRGPEVLPPAEIDFSAFPAGKPRIVDYAAKWDPDTFEYKHTPRRFHFDSMDDALIAELRRLALVAWDLFGLRGYARVDFRVDDEGRAWILEVNANPCLSADAGFMAAAAETGMEPAGVIGRIVDSALGSKATDPGRCMRCS